VAVNLFTWLAAAVALGLGVWFGVWLARRRGLLPESMYTPCKPYRLC